MLTRILTGVISFLVFLPFLIFSDTIAFPIAMSICAVISTFEMLRCIHIHKNGWISIPLYLCAGALPIAIRYVPFAVMMPILVAGWLLLTLYLFAVTVLSHGKTPITVSCTALVTSFYIIVGFSAMVFLRDLHEGGKYLFLLPFLGAWMTDIFAYFAGRLFGKHKLIPDVSPKKTVEGSIGGILFCILAFVGFTLLYNRFAQVESGPLPIWLMIVVGFLTSIVAQIGDLSMSVIKRHYDVKDYGKIFPGHGGFLDRFDSVLAVSVILAAAFGIAFL